MQSIISQKTNKKFKKHSKVLSKQKPPPIYRFLDPYLHYHLFGDIVLPNKIWQSPKDTIYPLDLVRNYKIIRQIHVREHGLVFELEDINENSLASIGFLQERLRSLGNKNANDLADFLDFYQDYFLNSPSEDFLKGEESNDLEEPKVFDWIDKVLENNKENVVFLKGHVLTKKKDFKTKFLCYSFKFLELLTKEKNIFSEDFIRDCFRFSYVNDIEGFTLILKGIVIQKYKKVIGSNLLMRPFNTLLGKIKLLVNMQTFLFPKQGMFFHCGISLRENIDPLLEKKIMIMKKEENKKKKKLDPERKECQNHSGFMRLYYMK